MSSFKGLCALAFAAVASISGSASASEPDQAKTPAQILRILEADPRHYEQLNKYGGMKIVVIDRDVTDEKLLHHIRHRLRIPNALNDFTRHDRDSKTCYVYSVTRPENLIAVYQGETRAAFEDASKFSAREFALWVFFHELGHCGQEISGRFDADYESEADIGAIDAVRAGNPQSNIQDVVMAYRAMTYVYNNAMALDHRIKGKALPPRQAMSASLEMFFQKTNALGRAYYQHLDNRYGHETQGVALVAALHAVIEDAHKKHTPLVAQWAQLRLDAVRFVVPGIAAKGDVYYREARDPMRRAAVNQP